MEMANKSGVYKNFSGDINWQSTECKVRNADFEILEKEDENNNEIVFADAVFVSGKVLWSVIKNGLNLGCYFHFCDIEYMINRSGGIYHCAWHDGIFEGGVFKYGRWFDGIWIKGEWYSGRKGFREETSLPPDKWEE